MGKKSTKTTAQTVYGDTTTSNPYVNSRTTNGGTVSNFVEGSALDSVNNFVNDNINSLLDQFLNPSLENTTNQSLLNSFTNNLNDETMKQLENNIINPLSNRNMVRSSQATNMYNNLAKTNARSIADYSNQLLSQTQQTTAGILSTLMGLYLGGYNVLANNQQQSLATSQGNATRSQTQTTSGVSLGDITGLLNSAASLFGSLSGFGSAASKK